jgi:hypothetical protein
LSIKTVQFKISYNVVSCRISGDDFLKHSLGLLDLAIFPSLIVRRLVLGWEIFG